MLKRVLFTMLWAAVSMLSVHAQTGLEIDKAFERYGHEKGCKMVEMYDARLRGYQLHVYKSLTYKKQGDAVDALLKADRKQAKKIREVVEDGRITGGYYMMPTLPSGMERYILFSNGSRGEGSLIYIEGHITPSDIMKLCYTRTLKQKH